MTNEELAAIKARCEAATGPWERKAYRVYHADRSMGERLVAAFWRPWGPVSGPKSIEADVEFCAHAREDVTLLLDAIDTLRGMLMDAETEAQMWAAEVDRQREKVAFLERQWPALQRQSERADCDRSPCSCGMHRDRT